MSSSWEVVVLLGGNGEVTETHREGAMAGTCSAVADSLKDMEGAGEIGSND